MFYRLLVPLDQSTLSEQALGMALSITRASDAGLDLATVRGSLAFGLSPKDSADMDEADNYLESIVAEIKSGAGIKATHGVLRGDPAEMICARASDVSADLIVMTTHGRSGFSRAWLGSVADGVIRRSTLPVLLVRPKERGGARSAAWAPMKQIVVSVDGSNLATQVLPSATKLARAYGASIVLLQVVQPVPMLTVHPYLGAVTDTAVTDDVATQVLVDEAERHVEGLVRKLREEGISNAESHVVLSASVPQAIIEFARSHHADLIAMSTHGRGVSRLIVGSVADKVRRSTEVSVLLQHPAIVSEELGFLTPKSVGQQLPALAGG